MGFRGFQMARSAPERRTLSEPSFAEEQAGGERDEAEGQEDTCWRLLALPWFPAWVCSGLGTGFTVAVLEAEHVRVHHCLCNLAAQLVNEVDVGRGILDDLECSPVSTLKIRRSSPRGFTCTCTRIRGDCLGIDACQISSTARLCSTAILSVHEAVDLLKRPPLRVRLKTMNGSLCESRALASTWP